MWKNPRTFSHHNGRKQKICQTKQSRENTGQYYLVCIRYRLISRRLEPVLIHTKKLCLASYYIQFSTNIKIYHHKIKTCFFQILVLPTIISPEFFLFGGGGFYFWGVGSVPPPQENSLTTTGPIYPEDQNPIGSVVTEILRYGQTDIR